MTGIIRWKQDAKKKRLEFREEIRHGNKNSVFISSETVTEIVGSVELY